MDKSHPKKSAQPSAAEKTSELLLEVSEADKLTWMRAAARAQMSLENWITTRLLDAAQSAGK